MQRSGIEDKQTPIPRFRFTPSRLLAYLYNAFDLADWGRAYLGAYYANHAYAGPSNNVGLMAGLDVPIMKGKVYLMGNLMTGNNDISVAVVGAVFYLPSNWQLSFGAQLPAPGS
jgi:hypothetical protein